MAHHKTDDRRDDMLTRVPGVAAIRGLSKRDIGVAAAGATVAAGVAAALWRWRGSSTSDAPAGTVSGDTGGFDRGRTAGLSDDTASASSVDDLGAGQTAAVSGDGAAPEPFTTGVNGRIDDDKRDAFAPATVPLPLETRQEIAASAAAGAVA